MRIVDTEIKEIIKSLEKIGYSVGVETVFRDWCECAALAFSNGCDLLHGAVWERREKRYLDIIGKYKKDAGLFAEMLARLANAFEADPWQDHLGRVYMECFGGNKHLGQCFTPIDVCRACAGLAGIPEPGKRSTLYEPACGGGAMVIAYLRECREAGYDYQRLLRIYAADLYALCVHMCYVQLSLLLRNDCATKHNLPRDLRRFQDAHGNAMARHNPAPGRRTERPGMRRNGRPDRRKSMARIGSKTFF